MPQNSQYFNLTPQTTFQTVHFHQSESCLAYFFSSTLNPIFFLFYFKSWTCFLFFFFASFLLEFFFLPPLCNLRTNSGMKSRGALPVINHCFCPLSSTMPIKDWLVILLIGNLHKLKIWTSHKEKWPASMSLATFTISSFFHLWQILIITTRVQLLTNFWYEGSWKL